MPRRAASVRPSGTSSRSGTRRTVSARARPVTSVCPPRGDPRRCARADQPSPANLLLTSGTFDKIPHYPRSQTLAAPSKATTLPNEGAAVGQEQVQYTIQVYPPPSQG
jgi:hypothetical protein